MTEQGYQSKIIKAIEGIGGVVVNGTYSKAGIADLICGWPTYYEKVVGQHAEIVLIHLHIEVKTEKDYERVMRSVCEEKGGLYHFESVTTSLKKHEFLQITKLNAVRKLGGKALIAWSIQQVEDYMNEL